MFLPQENKIGKQVENIIHLVKTALILNNIMTSTATN